MNQAVEIVNAKAWGQGTRVFLNRKERLVWFKHHERESYGEQRNVSEMRSEVQ